MKLIKLDDGCFVQSDLIAEVKVNYYADRITIRSRDGIGHSVSPRYGELVSDALKRIVAEIDEANK